MGLLLDSEETHAIWEQEALLNRLTDRIRASLELDEILQTTVNEVGTLLNLEGVDYNIKLSQSVTGPTRLQNRT
ncbi:MAG: hypothetical protein GDA56_12885 [Hormoscilla sp. GM7CHS1pb]|nr:hypothetical protein [Hormoscilla sp. GM7CHS1pb]